MAKKKKTAAGGGPDDISAEQAGREFGVALKELETLMQTRGLDGIKDLNDNFGGIKGMGEKLKTNLIIGKFCTCRG